MGGIDQSKSAGAPAYAAGLNAEQLRAVEYGLREPSRPVIVLAGPGTGKTRTITHRIARLVEAGSYQDPPGGTEPERILAVTFTVNAAAQMRERLAELVGPAVAERVNVHTFHGFGRRVLQRFGDLLGVNWARMQLIDSAQRTRLMLELMEKHRLFLGRVAEGRTALVPVLESFISEARNRGLFAADCERYGAAWSARTKANAAGLANDALAAEVARSAEFSQRAALYRHYDAACRERQWFSFDDLILLPIRILREHAHAAAILRDEARHIVVDEFQDVNPAQMELLRLLAPAGNGSAERDLCVVGDDDQAIYGFRGSSDRAFADFARLWPAHETIPLSTTYRSVPPVLRVANAVIAKVGSRFRPDKKLELDPAGDAAKAAGTVEGVEIESDKHAGSVIGAMIQADRAERGGGGGVGFGRYAVIVRHNLAMERIGSELEVAGIPVRFVRRAGVPDDTLRDLLAWVELLANPTARPAAQRLLSRPPYSVPVDTIATWSRQHRALTGGAVRRDDSDESAREWVEETDEPGPPAAEPSEAFVPWLATQKPDVDGAGRAGRFLRLHAELSAMAMRESAGRATLAIIERTGISHPPLDGVPGQSEIDASREHARKVAALVQFLSFVRSREDRLAEPGGLAEFWAYYNELSEQEQGDLSSEDDDDRIDGGDAESEPDADGSAVTLLTAHRAKGLEFDTVFAAHVRPGGFPDKKRSDPEVLVPADLRLEWAAQGDTTPARASGGGGGGGGADEERRLFYVACTRAQRRLVLLAKTKKTRSKKGPVDYFNELGDLSLYSPRSQADVMQSAGATAADLIDSAAAEDGGLSAEQRLGSRLVRAVRSRLAELAADAEADGLGAQGAAAIEREASGALTRLAAASHLARHGRLPEWARLPESPAQELMAWIESRGGGGEVGPSVLQKMLAPLRLNFGKIDGYLRCPRCFYLKHVLGLEDDRGDPAMVGTAAHAALEKFYRQFQSAEADEALRPTLDTLLRFGHDEFNARWPRSRPLDRRQLDQMLAQLRLTHAKLHHDSLHVLENEQAAAFGYERNGVRHTITARIDRIDLAADGGVAIIDYKTGKAWKGLTSPEEDDLQLGLYAMALPSIFKGTDDEPATLAAGFGRAEYWILATGQRGVIDLASLDLDKVRGKIDNSIDGMLAGEFPISPKCKEGPCRVFALGLPGDPLPDTATADEEPG